MPFGAEFSASGVACFRLWAPNAHSVELCLLSQASESHYPMQPDSDGWWLLQLADAKIGILYRYRINQQHHVPDPASRYQPADVHGYSQLLNPDSWVWTDNEWRGRPWQEAVIYELHVGSFTPAGSFNGVIEKLDYLSALGITAIQLMPIADFPGQRNWGYDGVLPFAPDSQYGAPDDLKRLVQTAHAKGMMVFLDVVYNHFGPEGNYLHLYAEAFFSKKHRTPWGKGFNFDGKHSHWVRQFFIHNARYWLEEFHLDGLRLDAVQAIIDSSQPHFLVELANQVREQLGDERQIHLILENDSNTASYLNRDTNGKPTQYTAQWNDDIHHALHVLLTSESWGYYQDFTQHPLQHLSRCLTSGFAYQGEISSYRNAPRGEPSAQLSPLAFISFLQNHDQIGNRALAERIHNLAPAAAIRAATALLLLAPFPTMLFMGQEWGCRQPFGFFCDFEAHLAKRVNQARRREFADMPGFETTKTRRTIADPAALSSFQMSILDWQASDHEEESDWLSFHRKLLRLRQQAIIPRLPGMVLTNSLAKQIGSLALQVDWQMGDGSRLTALLNLGEVAVDISTDKPAGQLLYATLNGLDSQNFANSLPAWSVIWLLVPVEQTPAPMS
ncbi:MAG: malto-oligosyltrehalose trehalohydrolase [Methylomonas lenta]|nr:malto-oligosyltrehalose trehalohydrolase [Methylomonas lenta]